MNADIVIDGSEGEGGGQVLRTALTFSLLTGKSFRMIHIRARRKNPGLAPQHLKSIEAAANISRSHVEGASIGAREIFFQPDTVTRGNYFFDIRTAGSTSLVFQTICFPLSWKAPGSTLTIRGGTHVSHSPSFHYLERQWLPWMKRLGYEFQLDLRRAGYYPKGGGEIFASCGVHHHAPELKATQRGALTDLHILSTYSNIPQEVAERQIQQASAELSNRGFTFDVHKEELSAFGSGSQLMVNANYEEGSCSYFALGERGVSAEKTGEEPAQKFLNFHVGQGSIDQYLADQMLIPAVLNRYPITYTTNEITQHLLTNRGVILKFVPVNIRVHGELGHAGKIQVEQKAFE